MSRMSATRVTHLPGFRNLNQRAVIQNPDGSQTAGDRPYPAFGDIQWMENRVSSDYNSFQVSLEKRSVERIDGACELHAGRSASPTRPITSPPVAAAQVSTQARSASRRTPTIWQPIAVRRSSTSGTGLSRAMSGNCRSDRAADSEASGTARPISSSADGSLRAFTSLQSGLALTATLGGASVLNLGGERRARPNLVGDPELPVIAANHPTVVQHRRLCRVQPRRRRRSATRASGSCAGPATRISTSRWPRTFGSMPSVAIQFRTEIFNAFNRANFGPPNIARDSSGFGQILTAGNARIVQFGLKFYF